MIFICMYFPIIICSKIKLITVSFLSSTKNEQKIILTNRKEKWDITLMIYFFMIWSHFIYFLIQTLLNKFVQRGFSGSLRHFVVTRTYFKSEKASFKCIFDCFHQSFDRKVINNDLLKTNFLLNDFWKFLLVLI